MSGSGEGGPSRRGSRFLVCGWPDPGERVEHGPSERRGAARRDAGPEPAEGAGEADREHEHCTESDRRGRGKAEARERHARKQKEGRARQTFRQGDGEAPERSGGTCREGPARYRVVQDSADEVESDPDERQGETNEGEGDPVD